MTGKLSISHFQSLGFYVRCLSLGLTILIFAMFHGHAQQTAASSTKPQLTPAMQKQLIAAIAENAAGRSKQFLDSGERQKAIITALKGLPKNLTDDKLSDEFAPPMEALKAAYRSTRVRIDIDYLQPFPMLKSRDSRRVATGISDGKNRHMVLWDTATGKEMSTLVSFPITMSDVLLWPYFSADGKYITVNTGPKTAAVWSTDDARRIVDVEGCSKEKNAATLKVPAQLNSDGTRLYFDGCVFSVPEGKQLQTINYQTILVAAKSSGIDTSWFSMSQGPTLEIDFVPGENILSFIARSGLKPRSLAGFFDIETAEITFVPIPKEFGSVGRAYPLASTSLKARRMLVEYVANNQNAIALLDTENGNIVWIHVGPEWSLAGLSPDGSRLFRMAPNHWEFYETSTGAPISPPRGVEFGKVDIVGDIYNKTGQLIIMNTPSWLDDIWQEIPDGIELVVKAAELLTPEERQEVEQEQLDF